MKKLGFQMVLCLVLLLCACGADADTPASQLTTIPAETDCQYPHLHITLGMAPESLLSVLQAHSFPLEMPDYSEYEFPGEVETPIKDGRIYNLTDLSFSYHTPDWAQHFTFSLEGKLQSFGSRDASFPTPEGLKTGDSIKRMQQIYGTDFQKDVEDYSVYQYKIDGGWLNIFYENDTVTSWFISVYPNINND